MESMNKIQLTTALISLGKFSYMSFSTPYYKNKCIFELCNFRLHSFIYFLKGSPEMKKVAIVMGSDSDLPIVKKQLRYSRISVFPQNCVFCPLTAVPQKYPSLQEMPKRTAQAL